MNEFLEYEESKKSIKSLNLDDFSIEDLDKYTSELKDEINKFDNFNFVNACIRRESFCVFCLLEFLPLKRSSTVIFPLSLIVSFFFLELMRGVVFSFYTFRDTPGVYSNSVL